MGEQIIIEQKETIWTILSGVGAIIAALAAGYAALMASRQAKETSNHNQKILRESIKNRHDDALPVLVRSYSENRTQSRFTNCLIDLKDVGNGPLFNLRIVNKDTPFVIRRSFDKETLGFYELLLINPEVDVEKIKWDKNNKSKLRFTYKNMYEEPFTTELIIERDGSKVKYLGDLSIPKQQEKKIKNSKSN